MTNRPSSERPTLAELKLGVGGGWIESLDAYIGGPGTPIVAYGNEEGRIVNPPRPVNLTASFLCRWPYPLVGPVIISQGFDGDPDDPEINRDAPMSLRREGGILHITYEREWEEGDGVPKVLRGKNQILALDTYDTSELPTEDWVNDTYYEVQGRKPSVSEVN